jgi:hypothetical protein
MPVGLPGCNDFWRLSNANGLGGTPSWTQVNADAAPGSPARRHNPSVVYDAANSRLILFGGCLGGCLPVDNSVWVLSNANGLGGTPTWTQLSPTGGPPPARQAHVAVFDPTTNSMIIFAGQNGGGSACGTFSDVWVLSNAIGLGGTPTWTQLSPSGGPPAGQNSLSAVYDPTNNIMTVFAGVGLVGTSCTNTNAVWTFSHANGTGGTPVWTNIVANGAIGSPAARGDHTAIYDSVNNRMTIYGGVTNSGLRGDVWVLSNANGLGGTPAWTRLSPSHAVLAPRAGHSGTYDSVNNRMIVFAGGSNDGGLSGTWVLTHPNGL